MSKAFGAATSKDLPPLQGKGVTVSIAKRTMPRVMDADGYEQLRKLVQETRDRQPAMTPNIFQDLGTTAVGDLLPELRFPKTADVRNTLPSFYQSYQGVAEAEAEINMVMDAELE